MDLFDEIDDDGAVASDATGERNTQSDQELSDWINTEEAAGPPPDDEMEARFCGEERAGIPSWSASAVRLGVQWRALLAAATPERAAQLERIEEESYRAARRRKVARLAMEAEAIVAD